VFAILVFAVGTVVGSRGGASNSVAGSPVTITVARPADSPSSLRVRGTEAPARQEPTRAGAIAAAARSITAFDGEVLLEPARLRRVVERIASVASSARLIAAFDQASAQTRAKLGADTVPKPVILLRSVPVGYRVERFSVGAATVAVWYVGIVASGATVQPQQSWRTQIVTLVWEDGAWKVSSFESSPGPTPPLSTADVSEPPGELFAAIPRFQGFERAEP
jgi:hypothetical protein